MEIISSKQNANVVFAKHLQDKKFRKENNMCLLEGEKLIIEALKLNIKFVSIFILVGQNYSWLNSLDCKMFYVNSTIIKYLSSHVTPQGVIAVIDTNYQYDIKTKRLLVLENIQNPDNFGAIIRSAVATGFNKIYTINCVDKFNEKVVRASMGTIFKTNVVETNYQQLKTMANNLYIADMSGKNVFEIETFNDEIGLVIGNEGNGISEHIKSMVKNSLSIPMLNDVESLNASVSAGILMYQIFSKTK